MDEEPRGRARVRWHELLAGLDVAERVNDADVEVGFITEDSRRVRPGTCFACRPGARFDGHDHAAQAVADGAVALLVERALPLAVPQARVRSVPKVLGPAAARLYGEPSRTVRCLGVTGTAGKSTTATLLESIARSAGEHTGLIGNDGVFVDGGALEVEKWGGTNMPQADQLQYLLALMRDDGVQTVAMEVTSRALDCGRVDATWFAAACFTNLSHEHLDDHGSMDAYFEAKLELFDPKRVGLVATNVDDPYGARVRDRAASLGIDVWTYALDDATADVGAADVVLGDRGATFTIVDRRTGTDTRADSPLIGRFNAANALGAAATALGVGFGLEAVAAGIGSAVVKGRAERVDAGQPFAVLVDYAHAPGELDAVLHAARALAHTPIGTSASTARRVVVVFGCGGDRDPSKRRLMGVAAGRGADFAVLTSDNPRSEDPQAIADAVLPGLREGEATIVVELDRRAAIRDAFYAARPGDVVVIAGKGPETGQTIADRTLPFDDRVVAREELGALGWS
ncbi:MAG: UDP-N-acetylmuramoyl-L-alanyl-D-glutamate--2,6-diaminopimelate ligase [Acidimicrobiia bacterium]